ncbi:MAG: DUF2304 domain-containing protein [Methanophagales archaeon]|nr:DUF2304 domain-containing protein [Methanophagales archaeon]
MMIGIQILGVIFALGMSYMTFLFYKRRDYPRKDFIFWMIIWLGFLVLVMFPTLAETLLKPLSVSNVMVLFTIFGFMLTFALLFYQHDVMRKNEKKLRTIVREMALNNSKRNKKE